MEAPWKNRPGSLSWPYDQVLEQQLVHCRHELICIEWLHTEFLTKKLLQNYFWQVDTMEWEESYNKCHLPSNYHGSLPDTFKCYFTKPLRNWTLGPPFVRYAQEVTQAVACHTARGMKSQQLPEQTRKWQPLSTQASIVTGGPFQGRPGSVALQHSAWEPRKTCIHACQW